MLQVKDVHASYGGHHVLNGVDLELGPGKVLCLLGPNGVGKTTLFKTVLGLHRPSSGRIVLEGRDLGAWSARERARLLAWVPQAHVAPFPFRVLDVALMGAAPRVSVFSAPSRKDAQKARECLELLGIGHLENRTYTELSGGERQLVLIARALVQDPRYLILDEPTSNLDFSKQIRVLEQVNLLASLGMGIIMTTHFPNHVFLCPGTVALMGADQQVICGPTDTVLTQENLEAVFGIPVLISTHELPDHSQLKSCLPLPERFARQGRRVLVT